MRDGKKQKIIKNFVRVLHTVINKNVFFQKSVFYFFENFKIFSKILDVNNLLYFENQPSIFFSPISNKSIESTSPVFTFFIQKVNKKIQKYSRGKSGKYVLSWKYTPPKKRPYVVFHWLKKDISLQKNLIFYKRLLNTFNSFIYARNFNFTFKLRKFVHHFVFTNYRKNLFSPSQKLG